MQLLILLALMVESGYCSNDTVVHEQVPTRKRRAAIKITPKGIDCLNSPHHASIVVKAVRNRDCNEMSIVDTSAIMSVDVRGLLVSTIDMTAMDMSEPVRQKFADVFRQFNATHA